MNTSLDQLLLSIGSLHVRLELTEMALAQKTAELERMIEEDSKQLQAEMSQRSGLLASNGDKKE